MMKKIIVGALISICLIFASTPLTAAVPFTDVKTSDWFYSDVSYAYENNLFEGTSSTTFSPNGTMTRGMFVTVLGRFDGVDISEYSGATVFTDVKPNSYYTPYINWAYNFGVVDGVGSNRFAPDQPVTREQMAKMICNYSWSLQYDFADDPEAIPYFNDESTISSWAVIEVDTLRSCGIVKGDNKGNFNPRQAIKRAEAAAIFVRFDASLNSDITWQDWYAYWIGESQENFLIHDVDGNGTPELFVGDGKVCTIRRGNLVVLTDDGFIAQTELLFPATKGLYYQIHHKALTEYGLSGNSIYEVLLMYWETAGTSSGYAFYSGDGTPLLESDGLVIYDDVTNNCTSVLFIKYEDLTEVVTADNIENYVN